MSSLKIDWCSYEAARYAVEHWHYSRSLPTGKLVRVGVWEDGDFVGCVVFGVGACAQIARPFAMKRAQVCELVRIAMKPHSVFVTQVVARSLRMLKRHCPGIRVVVSYADQKQGHLGKIYQAGNWLYLGEIKKNHLVVNSQFIHTRSASEKWGCARLPWLREKIDPDAHYVKLPPKHKYAMPLDRKARRQLLPDSLPYPKKNAAEAEHSAAPAVPGGRAG